MKRFLLLAILSLSIFQFSNAQIGGLSASKLATYCTSTVGEHTIEFEPSFSISKPVGYWLEQSRVKTADTAFANEFDYRFTYGVNKNIETGFALTNDVSALCWGIKYRVIKQNIFSLALMSGVNFDFTSKNFFSQAAVGAVSTLQYDDNTSTDINFQFAKDFNAGDYHFYAGIDNGIYIGNIQYICGINYEKLLENDRNIENLFFSPGVTIEPAHNFLMVLSAPISVYGKNIEQTAGFAFALTITID